MADQVTTETDIALATDLPVTSRLHQARWVVFPITALALLLVANQVFLLRIAGFQLPSTGFYYALIGMFFCVLFLTFPMRHSEALRVPVHDWVFSAISLGTGIYFASIAGDIINRGWDFEAPILPTLAALALFVLILEGLRRTGGTVLFYICLVFAVFPIVADYMPGLLWGSQYTPRETLSAFVMGSGAIVGVPVQVVSELVIGYLLFGAALTVTGGGKFFMDFASALLGQARGGPAKVSIISSGLFGSLSGSVVSNVISTGAFTIPTMKRCGYPPHYAGAVEACASTGGSIMPPVMGAAGFIMASFLNVPYATVVSAAILPAVLFYAALLLQVDAYAARNGLAGLPKEELPDLGKTLRKGWPHLVGVLMLVGLILFAQMERSAPFISAGFMLTFAILRSPKQTWTLLAETVLEAGRSSAYLYGILAGIGLIVGSLSITGVGSSVSRELVFAAGDNVYLLLVFGAITSFVLGMGMTASACYIFLAIILGPALTQQGLDIVASHLFILYWGMLSYITPPVALAAVVAAGIAGSGNLRTGMKAMRLGSILFILPFAFVLNPALILRGDLWEILQSVGTAGVAIWLIACAFEGYLHFIGRLPQLVRVLSGGAGLCLLVPEARTDILGLGLCLCVVIFGVISRKRTALAQ
ncbi:TRAP transporter 4TM/12TM fusion protein [Pacificibacter maritimus]|uniref:TRAP transporter 4TM/12TM fusion protein n=1 Tax=Pacificibacter maritimus TaxID=762213 RepID=A0A3N4UTW1_9RHOB|nr:TRAP transporter fused permease subunit [Pacificibacter maritimus]RPE70929.1 TRAP transporter 4TM/12TM fusion protein [Pacificibacter maritimus]